MDRRAGNAAELALKEGNAGNKRELIEPENERLSVRRQ
jgi:hypothetical protein